MTVATPNSSSTIRQFSATDGLILLFTLLLVLFGLWLPFGFGLTALIEEWGILGTYIVHNLFFIADVSSPFGEQAWRPLTILPHSIGYFLDANSFNYWHLLLMLSLFIKGFAFGFLIKKISNNLPWALLAAVLVVIYPADTMQMTFRSIHINWALSLQLLASCFFVLAAYTKRLSRYLFFTFLAMVFALAAISMYEAAIPLLMLPFLMIFVKEGMGNTFSRLWERKLLIIGWVSSLALFLFYLYNLSSKMTTFHSAYIGGRSFTEMVTQVPYSRLISIGFLRALLGGWFDAFGMLFKEYSFYGYLYLGLIMSFISGSFFLAKRFALKNNQFNGLKSDGLVRLGLAGFLLLILGCCVFLYLPHYLETPQRTYLFAAPGAVMIWLVPFMLIAYRARGLAIVLSFSLIFAGLAAQLFQFHHYMQISTIQRTLLKGVVENYDGQKEKTLLIFDKTNQLNSTWMLPMPDLNAALSYLYNHAINPVIVCRLPSREWQLWGPEPGSCIEHEDSWSLLNPKGSSTENKQLHPNQVVLKKDLVTLTIESDGSVVKDPTMAKYRQDLYHDQNQTSLRFRKILADKTWPSHFSQIWKSPPPNSYRWDFGDWWGLDTPISGNGWSEAGWIHNNFHHIPFALKKAADANLQFNLEPRADYYKLQVRLVYLLSDNIGNALRIRINNHNVKFHWISPGKNTVQNSEELVATIPRKNLLTGANNLIFSSDLSGIYKVLSIKLFPADFADLKKDKT